MQALDFAASHSLSVGTALFEDYIGAAVSARRIQRLDPTAICHASESRFYQNTILQESMIF